MQHGRVSSPRIQVTCGYIPTNELLIRNLHEKLCDLFEALGLKKRPVAPEVYVMSNIPTN